MDELASHPRKGFKLASLGLLGFAGHRTRPSGHDTGVPDTKPHSNASNRRGDKVNGENGNGGASGVKWQTATGVLNLLASLVLAILGWFLIQMYETMSEMNKEVITLKAVGERNRSELDRHENEIDDLTRKYYSMGGK